MNQHLIDAVNRANLPSHQRESVPKYGKDVVEAYQKKLLDNDERMLYVIGHLLDIIDEVKK